MPLFRTRRRRRTDRTLEALAIDWARVLERDPHAPVPPAGAITAGKIQAGCVTAERVTIEPQHVPLRGSLRNPDGPRPPAIIATPPDTWTHP